MCYSALLSPRVTAAGTWHAFGLRKFRKKIKLGEKALKDKRHNNMQGWEDVTYRGREREKELKIPV